jgi:dTDP-4-amino-4,6-dideoxygalactose transaminase
MKNIPLAKPIIGNSERRAVNKVLRSGMLAQGPKVAEFESAFSKHVQGRECVAVNSGTSALHVALLALGIGPGDEVIVPSFTFAATANSVALTGAKPIFVDVDRRTFNIDPVKIEQAITSNTRAIQVVHLYGLAADMVPIMALAKKHNLLVIEDAAQAHLATIGNQPVGTFGDAAAFSFYPTKNMTSGEGGMIVLNSSEAARNCRLLRNQGMEARYQNEIVGFNLRMTDIHAAIGIEQLKKLPNWNEKRRFNANLLDRYIDSEVTPYVPDGFKHVYHQYTISLSKNRDLVSEFLTKSGIGNAVYYPTQVHKLPAFNLKLELEVTSNLINEVLSLPVHPSLTKKQIRYIAESVNKALEKFL